MKFLFADLLALKAAKFLNLTLHWPKVIILSIKQPVK